ncbi:hypothetical protein [Fibrella forsythiae]|uniref:TonB C-terminal domain-containing protein n=1 Tax=Fibrella forsythiae TaxID=2817061 RepID=A0ABS3JG78_9BACT|nr:hypothetical protein [Fibrella forsythiae]MBO0949005.1 hypothetical protein [Fibrella forsythiae]
MTLFIRISAYLHLFFFACFYTIVNAQTDRTVSDLSVIEYQSHDDYYERIIYVGKKKDRFIVETYLADSTLYRIDNYRFIDQGVNFGFLAVRHGPAKILYNNGKLYVTCDYNMNKLSGPFIVYYPDGAIKRRELYRNETVKKSVCYDTDGGEFMCEPFYQRIYFKGNPRELKAYLDKKLQPILDSNLSFIVTFELIINEIGQVVDVKMGAGRSSTAVAAAIRKMVQEMPRWHENELNWKPANMDGVAVPGKWLVQANWERSAWRVSFPF